MPPLKVQSLIHLFIYSVGTVLGTGSMTVILTNTFPALMNVSLIRVIGIRRRDAHDTVKIYIRNTYPS